MEVEYMTNTKTILNQLTDVKAFLITSNAPQDMVDFIESRIILQANKTNRRSSELTETQKENLILKDKVYSFIANNPKCTAKIIAQHFGISSQKLTPIVSKLLVDGSIVFETVKKVKYFTIVE